MKKMYTKTIKIFNPITIIVFVIGMLFANLNVKGQVPLISASDGGFENATSAFTNNGWTAVGTSARTWRVGTFGGAASGTKAAYWGTAAAYGGAASSAVGHFYRDVVIPAGATNVYLNYKLKYPTIDNTYDYFYVFATTPANTPVNAVIPTTGYTNLFTNTATAYAAFTAMPQIDLTAYAGTTVRLVYTFKTDAASPNAAPVVDDITLTYIAGAPCSGTPSPGNTISTANPICSGINFSLSLQNTTTGSGISYQWQSSPNNITWTNIAGATSSTFTGTQTIATYYHCLVTCSGNTGTSNAIYETMNTLANCYCTNTNTTSTTYMINNFSITGGITNITNNGSGFSTNGYGNFTAMTAGQVIGSSVNFYTDFLPSGYTYGVGIWIDWNQNGSFGDAGEQVYLSGAYVSSATGTITVPAGAIAGNTRMRVVANYLSTAPTACTGSGTTECEDYTFNVIIPTGCTGTPAPGNTISSANPICTGVNFTLSLQNTPTSSGITYQWQSSPDNVTWTDITGATSATYTGTQTSSTYYQCLVTCSGNTGTSTPLQVNLQTGVGCLTYCTSTATSTADEELYSITVNGASTPAAYANANGCATVAPGPGSILSRYSNFKTLGNLTTLTQGATVPFTLEENECDGATYFSNGMAIWVDWNQNGSFTDAGEQMYTEATTTTGPRTVTNSFIVPAGATLGQTIMRIVVAEGYSGATLTPCSAYSYGETEDWVVNVIASSPCAGTPTPGNTISSSNPICVGVNFTLSAQNITTGSGVTYQWQSSPDNITWTNISGATSSTFTGTQTVATYYQCLVTCSGITGTSTALLENMQTGAACLVYCTTSLQSGYGPDITNVTLNTLNNTSTYAGTAPGYVSYPATGTTTTSLMEGVSYTGNLTVSVGTSSYSSAISSVWIDYNQSGTFEASEWVQPFTAATSGSITINVPVGAALGLTKMRVRIRGNGNTNGSGDACTNFGSGETEDYWVTIIAAPICSGTPTPGNAVANPASVAPGGTTILSLSTPPAFSGLTYQWYSSPDNSTWTAISGANSSTYAATVPSNTYYQCLVTCSGSTGTSASVLVSMSYCYPVGSTTYYLSNFNTVGGITNIANTTGASPGGYFNYSSTLSCSQLAGSAITFNLTETGGTSYFYGWIDWNNDLDFADAGEAIFATSSYAASYSGAYTVPAGTAAGNYRMRVANSDLGTIVGPCGPWNYGEYEDYTFTVAPPPLPTITSLGSTNGCPGGSLIINGTNLLGTTSVTIGGTAATITANTATSLTVNTGTGTTGTITVTTGSGSVTSTETYTFYAVPTATATSNSPICEGATLNLTGSTDIGTSYSWAGPNGFTATTQNGSVSSAGTISTGTYSFTATSNGCFSVGTTSVTVNAIPSSVTANSSNSSICNGSSIDLTASGNSNGNTTMSYTEGFETFPPSGWTFINAGTGNQWTTSPIANLGASSMNYAVNAANAANAWGITQGISLLSGITYNISFYYGTLGGASYPENLKVTVGNSPTVAAQTTVLWDTPSITVTSWTQATFTYTPSISGNYYFGFNCYSVANMDHLFVDDFSVSGGTINPPTYSWTSLPAGYSSTDQNPTNVIPTGTTEYIVTAQNIYGCTNTASTTVTVNTPPVPSVSVTDNCGNSVLTASAYTGTLLWSTGESTSSITVSSAGTYTVAQVLGGCTSTSVSGIAAPITIPVAPAVSIVDNCGSSTLTASAYTGSLLWSSAESTASITTNSAGTFTVTQTENGCTSIAGSGTAAPIAIPVAPTVSVTDNCGNSTLTASSFTGTLLWSSGESTASITTTTAGTFTVEQTENGCTSIDGSGTAAPLTIPVASITSSIDPTSCTIANGSATASGGTIYTWSTTPVQTTATATGLAAGVYTVTVSDGSCESTASVNIAAPGAPSAPSVSIVDNCGNSTITASGFTGTLLWSTGESTSSITATNAGTYNVTQTVNGCLSAPATIIAAPITIPSAPSVTVSNNCGTSTLTASGYTGTLLWSSGESTSSITTTSAGNFTVTQTENGCTSIDGFGTAAPIAIPVTLTISVTDSCGTSTLTASGYTGSLLWSSGESTASIITTSGGNFTVTQTENGCASIAASGTAAPIAIPVAPTVNVVNNCGNSVMTASAYTGTLLWNTGETTSSISTTVSGTFSVSQTENGCTSILNTVNTVPLTIPTVSLGNDTTICASQAITIDAGNAGSSFAWNPNGQSTQTITVDSTGLGLGATTISVMVTDINLCVSSDTIVITFDPCTGIVENNVTNFNVVPNPSNGEFYLTVSGISEITNINIYNMNGQIIYKEEIKTDFNNKLINLQSYPKGMYFIRLNSKNNSYTEKIIID